MKRTNLSSSRFWEEAVGYSRAVRKGPFIFITGTVAAGEDGQVISPGDAYRQARAILDEFGRILEQLGSGYDDVVRTRIYVTDMALWEEVGRAHREVLGEVKPATTMVQVSALARPEFLVEIELQAVVDEENGKGDGA